MSFGLPQVLVLLAVVPFAWAAWFVGAQRGLRRARRVTRQTVKGPPVFASVLVAVALAAAVVAAARPQWGERDAYIPRRGAELFVVLDVSRSMGARDVSPSRLEAAKAAINETFSRLGGDRAGLIIFAGDAIVRSPLTGDLDVAERIVETLQPGPRLVGGGTSTASGLDLALDAFEPESEAGRIVLLISDGDDLGANPAATAARFAASGVQLFVAGVGTPEGATVPVVNPRTGEVGSLTGDDGVPVVTRLNEQILRLLATASRGQYLGSDLDVVPGAVSSRMASLATTQFDQRPTTIPIERAGWFAGVAAVLAVAAALTERFRSRRVVLAPVAALLAAMLLAGCAARAHTVNEDAIDAFEVGDYAAAVDGFLEAQAARPDDPAVALNLAAAYHAMGRYDEAATAARRALASPSTSWRARAQASIAHHRYAAGDLPGALEAFKRALLEDPNDSVARRDYEVVLRLLLPPPAERPSDDGGTPVAGASGTAAPGDPTEGSGEGDGEGSGEGQGTATPGPGGTPEPGGGTPTAEAPSESDLTDAEITDRIFTLDFEIRSLLEEAGETPTAAQALEILRLIEERSRIAALRDGSGSSSAADDY